MRTLKAPVSWSRDQSRNQRAASNNDSPEGETFTMAAAKCLKRGAMSIEVLVFDKRNDPMRVVVPISQIHDDSEVRYASDTGSLIVTSWLARKRGWM